MYIQEIENVIVKYYKMRIWAGRLPVQILDRTYFAGIRTHMWDIRTHWWDIRTHMWDIRTVHTSNLRTLDVRVRVK